MRLDRCPQTSVKGVAASLCGPIEQATFVSCVDGEVGAKECVLLVMCVVRE